MPKDFIKARNMFSGILSKRKTSASNDRLSRLRLETEIMEKNILTTLSEFIIKNAESFIGNDGPKGDRGDIGNPGEEGERGPIGLNGPQGPMGPQGQIGVEGRGGKDGKSGKSGKNGKDGNDGKDGKGLPGLSGKDGKDGKDGSPDTGLQIISKVNNVPSTGAKIDASHIKNLPGLISTFTRRRGRVDIVDLSDQVNGITKSFTLPTHEKAILFVSTQAPLFYRPEVDFTISGNTGTFTSEVGIIQDGQTLLFVFR